MLAGGILIDSCPVSGLSKARTSPPRPDRLDVRRICSEDSGIDGSFALRLLPASWSFLAGCRTLSPLVFPDTTLMGLGFRVW